MTLKQLLEWVDIGARLAVASPKRFDEITHTLREALEACEIIASFDHQIFLRPGRPTKRYRA